MKDLEAGSADTSTRSLTGKRVLHALAAASLLGVAGCAGTAPSPGSEPAGEAASSAPAEAPASSAAPEASAGAEPTEAAPADQTYEDGEFTQVGSYVSPGGTEEIGVSLTLEKDVVTAVTTEPMPSNPTAKLYQERFSGGIQEEIVGKKLDELKVDKVAGSSLTSGGFAEATDLIKSEAKL
ncbi:hypothetical protein [uncultured Arthrobacter sp.]|uniref:hypothetical protein n=1 Tax=uncultured Arthrobacter sp. TaxID=114050 RepID=UPI0025D3F75B|nr:hypothetical protein [uncultured Arthrobacter sp.]